MSIVTASDWMKGISLSILASIIGGASKLAIRKSWLMQHEQELNGHDTNHHSQHQHHHRNSNDISLPDGESRHYNTTDEGPSLHDDSYHAIQENNGLPSLSHQHQQAQHHHHHHRRHHYNTPGRGAISHGTSMNAEGVGDNNNNDDQQSVTSSSTSVIRVNEMRPSATTSHSPRDRVKLIAWFLRGSGMIGMTFLNPACSVMAMNYASPSILAPFSGLTLVWIVLLSQPLIHEQPTMRQVIAASLIILGEILVAIFGDHTNDGNMTIADVTKSYHFPPFIAYMVGMVLWICLLLYWIRYHTNPTLKRFAWGVTGGSITGFQNFLKDTLTLVKASKSDHVPLPWYTSLLAFLAISTAFVGLLFLTACMKRYDATYSAAMFVGSFVVSASLMAAAHYETFAHLVGLDNLILYPSGLLVLMGGVWMLIHEKGAVLVETRTTTTSENNDGGSSDEEKEEVSQSSSSAMARVELEPLVVQERQVV